MTTVSAKLLKMLAWRLLARPVHWLRRIKRFYATRDITATVDSIPLITASILAKKLAEGLDALVMDVKVGSGAFMPTYELSEALAEAIVGVANGAGVRTTALLTDMNQVLASSAVTRLKYVKRCSS